MTGNTLEQRALLPCPCGRPAKVYSCGDPADPRGKMVASCDDPECSWSMYGFGAAQVAERWNRRDEAALRLPAGDGWVLVPRIPTEAMCEAAGDGPIFIEGRMDGNTFIQSTHYDQRYLLDTWDRMLAAAPRHETGEVQGNG